jgi:hypothetical protein
METKEEILDKHSGISYGLDHQQQQFIIDAMEEYAKQEAIAFSEYLNEINQKKYSEGFIERMYVLFKMSIK